MRILFFSNEYPQPSDPGRAVFNFELVRHLAETHDVRAIVPVPWTEALVARLSGRHGHSIPAGPMVLYPPSFFPPRFFTASRASWMAHSTRGAVATALRKWRPDVVLAYWADPDGTVAMAVARSYGSRGVIMVGGSDVLLLTRQRKRRVAIVAALKQADAVITVSRHLRDRVIELGIPPESVHVVRRPVDPRRFFPGDRLEARRQLGIATDSPVVVWAGRFVPVKSVDLLIHAFSELMRRQPQARLFLLGTGPLRQDLAALARRLGIAHAVHFAGSVPHHALGDWLRAADLVALSSRSEGMPNLLLEAAACDVPFVACDVGGIRELADPAIDRLVPHDAHAFAAAMAELVDAGPRTRPRRPPPPLPAESLATLESILAAAPAAGQAVRARPARRPNTLRQLVRRGLAAVLPRRVFALSGPVTDPCVYLTFDDGPDPVVTPRILDALAEARAVATFFLIGERAMQFPELVRRIAAEGHELAHHSYSHVDPGRVSSRELCDELRETARVFAAAGQEESRLVRPPHGKLTLSKLLRLWANGYVVVLWNSDPWDAYAHSAEELVRWFDRHPVGAGDIILLHDTRACTAEALPRVIASIRNAGLSLATVSRAVGLSQARPTSTHS